MKWYRCGVVSRIDRGWRVSQSVVRDGRVYEVDLFHEGGLFLFMTSTACGVCDQGFRKGVRILGNGP